MKKSMLLFLICIGFAKMQAATPTTIAGVAYAVKSSEPSLRTPPHDAAQATILSPVSPRVRHLFPVKDVKGLLLTCVAPEIETNPNTDVFSDCTLAPGRTLDDVMHTFIGAIHFIQNEEIQEQADHLKATQK